MNSGQFTLAIESAIGGGSISLIGDGGEVAHWIGGTNVLRAAEDLLPTIDELLKAHYIASANIGLIAVSAGPGSFTGIRIGLATALGMKAGLDVPMASVSALAAMASAQATSGDFIVAIPAGRNAICVQRFTKSAETAETSPPAAMSEEEFAHVARNDNQTAIVAHSILAEKYGSATILDFGSNIANAVGIYCRDHPDVMMKPLFISKNF